MTGREYIAIDKSRTGDYLIVIYQGVGKILATM